MRSGERSSDQSVSRARIQIEFNYEHLYRDPVFSDWNWRSHEYAVYGVNGGFLTLLKLASVSRKLWIFEDRIQDAYFNF